MIQKIRLTNFRNFKKKIFQFSDHEIVETMPKRTDIIILIIEKKNDLFKIEEHKFN